MGRLNVSVIIPCDRVGVDIISIIEQLQGALKVIRGGGAGCWRPLMEKCYNLKHSKIIKLKHTHSV